MYVLCDGSMCSLSDRAGTAYLWKHSPENLHRMLNQLQLGVLMYLRGRVKYLQCFSFPGQIYNCPTNNRLRSENTYHGNEMVVSTRLVLVIFQCQPSERTPPLACPLCPEHVFGRAENYSLATAERTSCQYNDLYERTIRLTRSLLRKLTEL